MTAEIRRQRQIDLYIFLRQHSGQHFTMAELAMALGRTPNGSFRTDLSAVRHIAQEADEVVTNCAIERRSDGSVVQTLHHHGPDNEDGQTIAPLITQGKQVRTRIRNQGRQGAFTNRHGVSPADRKQAGLYVRVAEASEALLEMIDVAEEMRREVAALAEQAVFTAAARKRDEQT